MQQMERKSNLNNILQIMCYILGEDYQSSEHEATRGKL